MRMLQAPRRPAPSELLQLLGLGAPLIPEPQKPDGDPPYSRHVGRAPRSQTDGPCRGRLSWDTQDAETALTRRGTWPHGHHGDRSQPQAGAQVQAPRRRPSAGRAGLTVRPVRGLGLRAARRPRRRVGTASSQRCPRPGAPAPVRRSHTHFTRHRGPTRTQAGAKRGKRSGVARARRSCPRGPGRAHERPMGSRAEGPPHQPGRPQQDTDEAAAAKPRAALLERHVLCGELLPGSGCGPFFYIGGSNGASIISSYCKSKGWQRIQDGRTDDYRLKWCEVRCRGSYHSFREGEQLLFQLPNNKLLTTKIGLLSALREHSRAAGALNKVAPCAQARVLQMEDFFPETYRLDMRDEREAFFTLFDETQMWICKPTACNQGKGIFLLRSQEEVAALQAKTQSAESDLTCRKTPFRVPQARVVQRYIQNPLLLDGKKFDVRAYLLIACAVPYMVFFGHGYARLTLGLYDPHSRDLSGHLTNQFMQKKSPLYMLLKEDTVWSMDHLNRYINDKFRKTKGLPRDWVFTAFTTRMQQIMAHCFLAVKSKLECKLGYFDLIGCDFLIDENFKVWLLEMNSNPALHTNCEVLKEVIPAVVMETLDLALETLQKSLRSQKMLPLLSQRHFVLLHNGEADVWPRPAGPRGVPRLPLRSACEATSLEPPAFRAADRPGAHSAAPPGGAGSTPGRPHCTQRRPRPPDPSPDGTQAGEREAQGAERPPAGREDPAREPSPAPGDEDREDGEEQRKSAGHRGS